jgi:uncharacterized protein (UPF0276 family)
MAPASRARTLIRARGRLARTASAMTHHTDLAYPHLGFGLGLRAEHYTSILEGRPEVDWFEAVTENYLVPGGRPLHNLMRVRERFPVALHGVSLSDHLCWTGLNGRNIHDLLPLPYTEEALAHVVSRVRAVQEILGRRILLENVSSYLSFNDSRMTEWEFLSAVAEQSDCLLLLDVNNVYVSSVNHEFDPRTYIDSLPAHRVQQIHLAGHESHGDYLIDTHDRPVPEAVWALYAHAVKRFGAVPTMIERDANIPPLVELEAELRIARRLSEQPALAAEEAA